MRQSTGLPPSPRILVWSSSETGAGAIYRLEDTSAFEAALAANEDPSPALTLIESCIFPDVWDNVQQALEQ